MKASILTTLNHTEHMRRALAAAKAAGDLGEVPIGAAIVTLGGEFVAEAGNLKEADHNPVGHAEVLAIHRASRTLGRWRLSDCVLYVTLEPCLMCAGAIISARLSGVVFGARDPKAGAVTSLYTTLDDQRLNHRCEVLGGILETECSETLTHFFRDLRSKS